MKKMNRRVFFKRAAEKALPIMTMALITSLSITSAYATTGCNENCVGACKNSCYGYCSGYCKGGCTGSCKGKCSGSSAVCEY